MDAIARLEQEHREVERILQRLEQRPEAADVAQLGELLGAHSDAEERVVYPMFESKASGVHGQVEEALAEHAEVTRLLSELEYMEPTEPQARDVIQQLGDALRHHVEEEERDMFPRLAAALSTGELEAMGDAIDGVESEATGDADVTA